VTQKTVLLVDDEQGLLEPLRDALEFEGFRVITASTGSDALQILEKRHVDLVTVDVMLPPGKDMPDTPSHRVGVELCRIITRDWPQTAVMALSVVNDRATIAEIERYGVRFLRKGETPLRTVVNMLRSRLTGVAFDTHDPRRR